MLQKWKMKATGQDTGQDTGHDAGHDSIEKLEDSETDC